MCARPGPLPHLGDLVKVSAGQRDAIKDHVYCSENLRRQKKKKKKKKITPLSNHSLLQLERKW